MPEETAPHDVVASGGGGSGITLLVMTPEKVEAIMNSAQTMLESNNRHELEMIKTGVVRAGDAPPRPNGNCSNCILC